MSAISFLDQFLDPLTEALSPEVARRLVELRASAEVQARADELASKANAGTLTAAEEVEYKQFVEAVDIVSIMQAKARRFLAQHGSEHGTGNP
jgi:gamma-glutamyl phosphate reductase